MFQSFCSRNSSLPFSISPEAILLNKVLRQPRTTEKRRKSGTDAITNAEAHIGPVAWRAGSPR
eukprot:62450-Pelagomonas_calceolata.AAC.4